jgi:hypothetical protein
MSCACEREARQLLRFGVSRRQTVLVLANRFAGLSPSRRSQILTKVYGKVYFQKKTLQKRLDLALVAAPWHR